MKSEMDVQQQNIKHLLELVQQNPELKIIPLVDTDCVPGDDFSSWVAGWGKASIEEIYSNINLERICIKSDDYENLVDDLQCRSQVILSENEACEIVDSYGWEKVIVVRITTP